MSESVSEAGSRSTVPATAVGLGEGETIAVSGVEHRFLLTGAQTGGRLGLEEFVVPPATPGPRPHVHREHDETFYVLDGAFTVSTEHGEVVLGPGEVAHAPRGAVHGYRNADLARAARVLCLYTPPGYEQYFRDVHAAIAAGEEMTDDRLAQLRRRYGTHPWP